MYFPNVNKLNFTARAMPVQKTRLLGAVVALLFAGLVLGSDSTAEEPEIVLEEVVVTGQRPGPPLWQVRHGDRVLWIFGLLEPLPKSLQWDTESVDWVVSQSQEVISPPFLTASVSNPFKAVGVVRRYNRLKRLPKGQTLQDVLPTQLYDRYAVAKQQFAEGDDKLDKLRPLFAAERLLEQAQNRVGLTNASKIRKQLRNMAIRHKVEVTATDGSIAVEDGLKMIDQIEMQAEIACLDSTLSSIASDLQASLSRAHAWAEGDASALKRFDYPDVDQSCVTAALNSAQAVRAKAVTRAAWLAAARIALQKNSSTFATLPIREVIHTEGLLAQLRAEGFVVRGQ